MRWSVLVFLLMPRVLWALDLPIELRDGKPMLAATIAGHSGVVMFDLGTAELLILNRDALPLPPGPVVARGQAASGQAITIRRHPTPPITLPGLTPELPDQVLSGDFGFTRAGLGADFLGFLGLPLVAGRVFGLDYAAGRLSLHDDLPDPAAGGLGPPLDLDLSGPLPRLDGWIDGWIDGRAIAVEIDTGDSGTAWLHRPLPEGARLRLGPVTVDPGPLRLVRPGSAGDRRDDTGPELIRLGAGFLARNRTLWDMGAGRLWITPVDLR